ncbi:hypothetical protein BAZSYMB_SCAFFOLD00114_2 [Bathymodiolus azoricus thioautotrophic gill symbiont]|uniref:Uncharacterized protein n=1 Tax=Bathymodiolus azoricus thioautotrophic gill symbiont TaxID=235205 RepID=A0A1H6LR96_9GAMM|nr:hypothetical protein BAZSYMB_SCAFFOLD00114_2 [Bathymodiolus azoricus thioautotrophic gill symbiont]
MPNVLPIFNILFAINNITVDNLHCIWYGWCLLVNLPTKI